MLRRQLRELVGEQRIAGATVLVTQRPGDTSDGSEMTRRGQSRAEGACTHWSASAGTADIGTGRPMNTTDRFRVGSTTKTFTATVVLQLAAEHRLSLDAPVDRYLPGLIRSGGYDGRRITGREILQHTSGLPNHTSAPEWQHPEHQRYRHFEPDELVVRALELPPPDTSWYYSTTNYIIAGMIIKAVTGHAPEDEITRRVLRPLGLRDTYWPGDHTGIQGPHSRSYFTAYDRRVDGTEWNMTFAGVGGALVSTLDDLGRFTTALMDRRVLPPAQLAAMRQTVTADPDRLWPGARYGLGVISTPLRCGGHWWGNGGTVPGGHRAFMAVGPGGRTVTVVLTEVPATLEADLAYLDVVQTAFCTNPLPGRTRP
ncbi:serine hydrolase domain-containing protein [Streptomyces sp. NPDC005820]|uniref:serine hydrolase domain-containing protein n=1 Tax=Streptomyces sp. NPDC005820 TaxID=3157069 RepID=UPI0033D8B1F5